MEEMVEEEEIQREPPAKKKKGPVENEELDMYKAELHAMYIV